MRSLARAVALFASLTIVAACREARAEAGLGLDLTWRAPAECPDEAHVRADIERLTGRGLGGAEATPVLVTATVERQSSGSWAVDLSIARSAGDPRERRVEGGTCREVADAAAVIVALALDEERAKATPPKAAPPPPPRPLPRPPPPPPPPPPRSSRSRWGLAAIGGVDAAALPAPAPGLGLAASFAIERNRFELGATFWLARRASLSPGPGGVDVALYAGALRYCRSLFGTTFELWACGGVEAGALRAWGVGLLQNGTGLAPWVAPELGLAGQVHLARTVSVSLEADGLAAIARDRFVVDGGEAYRPPALDGRGLLMLRFEAP